MLSGFSIFNLKTEYIAGFEIITELSYLFLLENEEMILTMVSIKSVKASRQ